MFGRRISFLRPPASSKAIRCHPSDPGVTARFRGATPGFILLVVGAEHPFFRIQKNVLPISSDLAIPVNMYLALGTQIAIFTLPRDFRNQGGLRRWPTAPAGLRGSTSRPRPLPTQDSAPWFRLKTAPHSNATRPEGEANRRPCSACERFCGGGGRGQGGLGRPLERSCRPWLSGCRQARAVEVPFHRPPHCQACAIRLAVPKPGGSP